MSPPKVKESHKNGKRSLGQSNIAGSGGIHRQIEKGIVKNANWDGFVPQECSTKSKDLTIQCSSKMATSTRPSDLWDLS